MAHLLLSQKLSYTTHIALFLILLLAGGNAIAQSDLQTGDVVVVSVNADTESVDFIPLVDIEAGTQLSLQMGHGTILLKHCREVNLKLFS